MPGTFEFRTNSYEWHAFTTFPSTVRLFSHDQKKRACEQEILSFDHFSGILWQ